MADFDLPADYVDLLAELDAAAVEYLLVGGWAVAIHGHGRATDDLDIFVRATRENATRIIQALKRFGAPVDTHKVTEAIFAAEGYGYRMERKPILIELLTVIDGVSFDEALQGRVTVAIGGVQVPVIGREALLTNKRAAGRPKDLADVEALTRDATSGGSSSSG